MTERLTPGSKKLFAFLSVAAFFEGYDFMALSQVLPNFRQDMGLSESATGAMYSIISLGTVVAYLLVRLADKWGRKPILTLTIAGYTITTFASGLAPDHITFTAVQFLARVFLIAEYAICMVYAAEEFPAAKRGMVIGVITGFTSLGAIACAGTVPMLLKTTLQWRLVYLIAIVPLVLIMYARRNLQETARFRDQVAGNKQERRPFNHILFTPYRKWVIRLGLIWGAMYMCGNVAVFYWKDFAVNERGLSEGQAGTAVTIAAVAAMPLVFLAGRMVDRFGRRWGGAGIFTVASAGVVGSYTLHGQWPLTLALVFGIYGASAMPIVLNALTTELFPTNLRADAFAWCNNLLGRVGYVLSPWLVGLVAERVGSKGPVLSLTAVFPMIAVVLIFLLVPETNGRELEDTARLAEQS